MAETRAKLVIVGIGDDGLAGLTEAARRVVAEADLILGAPATLRLIEGVPARKVPLDPEMPAALRQVREALTEHRPVLVSSGDPLFYGVARYLCDRLGKDQFEVVPHVSSMQLAFARVKESWEDAYLTSLAGRPLEAIVDRIRTAEKVGLFSSDELPPARLAQALLDRGIDYFRAYVCENLGSPDERVTQAELSDLVAMEFDPLHVLILVRKPDRPDQARLGEPAPALRQRRRRLRTVAAEARADHHGRGPLDRPGAARRAADQRRLGHRGRLGLGGDRGGPARQPGDGLRDRARAGRHRADRRPMPRSFAVPNVRPVAGRAPEVLATLPEPDAIFVGGTGRQVSLVLSTAYAPAGDRRPDGRQRRHDRRPGLGARDAQEAGRRGSGLERR